MRGCRCRGRRLLGGLLVLLGAALVIACVPVQLMLIVLGAVMAAAGLALLDLGGL